MSTSPPRLIVGLGNPGTRYAGTLHNAGALVLDALVAARGLTWSSAPKRIDALTASSGSVTYAKPTTFMNNSGHPVQQLLNFYKLSPSDLVVVYDDIDLLFGDVRSDQGKGAGGHNGVRSIIKSLGGDTSFRRVRVGVANKRTAQKPGRSRDVARIVLKRPGLFDRRTFRDTIEKAVTRIEETL